MQKCNYCGFISKYNVRNCPSCGASDYTKIENFIEYEVKTPPKNGYRSIPKLPILHNVIPSSIVLVLYMFFVINNLDIKSIIFVSVIPIIVSIFLIYRLDIGSIFKHITQDHPIIIVFIAFFYFLINLIGNFSTQIFLVVYLSICLFFINFLVALAISQIYSFIYSSLIVKKKYNSLINNGVLVKNLKYQLITDPINPNFKRIKVKYISKDGVPIDLISKQSIRYIPNDNYVDILIDKTDFSNYYIDFEIT